MNMTKEEFKKLFHNKILLISVIAICFIPILYAAIFDKSVWDPYGRAKDLPVAVVNEDVPVEMMGQKIDIGSQVVSNLKKNKGLDWKFVSKDEAQKGLKDLKYYTVVTIPKDFSKNAASVIDKEPKKMEITYQSNESLNYIANEISTVGLTELEAQVREQVVAAYVESVAQAAEQLVGGLTTAANGAGELSGGSGQLESGLTEYTNGVAQAFDGSGQLASGMGQLAGNIGPLESGVSQLDQGANQLGSALGQINSHLQPLQSRVGVLDAGLVQLSAAAQDLSAALATFESSLSSAQQAELANELVKIRQEVEAIITNSSQLTDISTDAYAIAARMENLAGVLATVSADVSQANANINNMIRNTIEATTEISDAIKSQLIASITSGVDAELGNLDAVITNRLSEVSTELTALSNDTKHLANVSAETGAVANAMAGSAQSIASSIGHIESAQASLQHALNQVPSSGQANNLVAGLNTASNDLRLAANGIPQALSGANQLVSGSAQLANGLDQMKGQMPTLSSGVQQLNSGAGQLQSGLSELNENSPELMSGIDQLKSGAQELASGLEKGVDESATIKVTKKNIEQFAAPTKLTEKEYSKVQNYGEALAPYIMSLALFVGTMLFNFVYPIRRISLTGQTSSHWWLSKVSLGFVVSSCMALIQATIMLLIGLKVDHVGQFYLTAFVSAWCYMAIVMFLAMTFDNPGRFVAMILLVLQLGGAGGTFPIQLQAEFYKAIHPFLPMSYSVYAFRNAIAGGIGTPLFIKSILLLLTICVAFVLLLQWSMHILQKKHLENVSVLNDNQKLQGMLD